MSLASLRSRIILSLVVIVTVTSGLFAFGVLLLKEKLEEVIFDDMVREQLNVIMLEVEDGSYQNNHLFKDWYLYRDQGEQPPALIASLPDGSFHHIIVDDRYYQVEIDRNAKGERFYLAYDITDWEHLEHTLLGWLAAGITLLAVATVFMGFGASRTILAPVRAFTRRIGEIKPDERQVQVADEFKGNEVSRIAKAFDAYLKRMDNFVERERSFTAAASHELRNPLSVMLGALEVIESSDNNPATLRATGRLRRAIGDMQAFIEAALLLSREESLTISNKEYCTVGEIITSLVEDAKPVLEQNQIELQLDMNQDLASPQPASLVKITIGNLLRNALEHTRNGKIRMSLTENTFVIEDEGEGISKEDLPRVFERNFSTRHEGTGMGLDLVRRICDRFHWQISIDSEKGRGTRITLTFPSL